VKYKYKVITSVMYGSAGIERVSKYSKKIDAYGDRVFDTLEEAREYLKTIKENQ